MENDDAIRATNDDAASCKRSAVQYGYWKDPYIQYFIRTGERKAPEIHRGYFARVKGIHILLRQFIEVTKRECQVINLGAGFDTTFLNLKDEGMAPKRFIEVDFQGVTNRKCYYIKSRKPLLDKLNEGGAHVVIDKYDLHSPVYHIISADLRNLSEFEAKLQQCNIDMSLPTVFIAECVLVYMPGDTSKNLLKWISDKFNTCFFVNYEQVNMADRFGQVMVDNLKARGCALAGIEHCLSLESQKKRFTAQGWEGADAWDMNTVYKNLPQDEVQSFSGLELLSQLQRELFTHYCIAWAYCDSQKFGLAKINLKRLKELYNGVVSNPGKS